MIVSILVLRKDGRTVVILGDFDKNDNAKEAVCTSQLLTCVEAFKAWAESKTHVDVIVPLRPDILTDKPKVDPKELTKLIYRIPLWIDKSVQEIKLTCADTRDNKGTEIVADLRSLLDREEILDQWIAGDVKIHNLSRSTWAQYTKSMEEFLAANKQKKLPTMVKALMENIDERRQEDYVKKQAAFGENGKLNMQRRIVYHSFKRCKKENRMKFLAYFRNNEHMMGDILFIKAIHTALLSQSRVLFIGKQPHAHTIGQYLLHGLKYEKVFEVEHTSANVNVEVKALNEALSHLLKKKKKRRKKKKEKKKDDAQTTEENDDAPPKEKPADDSKEKKKTEEPSGGTSEQQTEATD